MVVVVLIIIITIIRRSPLLQHLHKRGLLPKAQEKELTTKKSIKLMSTVSLNCLRVRVRLKLAQ